jgi:DDE superfamily endonuclease
MEDEENFDPEWDDEEATRNTTKSDVKTISLSSIHYRDGIFLKIPAIKLDISVDLKNRTPQPSKKRVPLVFKLNGYQFPEDIDLTLNKPLVEDMENLLGVKDQLKFQETVAEYYKLKDWPLIRVSPGFVDALFNPEESVLVPKENNNVDIGVEALEDILGGTDLKSISAKYSISYNRLHSWKKRVILSQQYSPLYLEKPKINKFPNLYELRSFLTESYRSSGCLARSWKDFCAKIQKRFPSLETLQPKTIQNKFRTTYRLRSMKPKSCRNGVGVVEQKRLEVVMGGFLHVLHKTDGVPLLYFDQVAFEYDSRVLYYIGTSQYPPHAVLKPSKTLYMLAVCDLDGLYAVQFSYSSANSVIAGDFLRSVAGKYSSGNCMVYLDNAAYQTSKEFKKRLVDTSIKLVYGVRGAPYLNIIENYFAHLKSIVKAALPVDDKTYLSALLAALNSVNSRSSIILKKFYDDYIKIVQLYYSMTSSRRQTLLKAIERRKRKVQRDAFSAIN